MRALYQSETGEPEFLLLGVKRLASSSTLASPRRSAKSVRRPLSPKASKKSVSNHRLVYRARVDVGLSCLCVL